MVDKEVVKELQERLQKIVKAHPGNDTTDWLCQDGEEDDNVYRTMQILDGYAIKGSTGNALFLNAVCDSMEGYSWGPGETDSFGWLTGVIHTPAGKLVWG